MPGHEKLLDVGADDADPLRSFRSEPEVVSPRARPSNADSNKRPRRATALLHRLPRWTPAALVFVSGVATGVFSAVLLSKGPAVPSQARADNPLAQEITSKPVLPTVTETTQIVVPAATSGITQSTESKRKTPAPSGHRGTLQVNSLPRGASVFLNNKYAGRTPLVLRSVPVGSRAVRVQLDGYASWSRGIQVVANESTTVRAELNRTKTLN